MVSNNLYCFSLLEMASDSADDNDKKTLKVKYNISYDSVREVAFCEHKTNEPSPEKPLKRTLFLSKIPPWVTEDSLKRIFSINGAVSNVFLLSKKTPSKSTGDEQINYTGVNRYLFPKKISTGFQFGYIVFEKPSAMNKALKEMDLSQPYIISTEEKPVVTGTYILKICKFGRLSRNILMIFFKNLAIFNEQTDSALRNNLRTPYIIV